jgi:hypothetical protein
MKYDTLNDSKQGSDYSEKYNPLSVISSIGKGLLYTAAVCTALSFGGCGRKHNVVGPEPVQPKIKADVSLVDIIKYDADNDSLKNDLKIRTFSVNDGWLWYSAKDVNGSVLRSDSSEVYGRDTASLILKNIPVGENRIEIIGRNYLSVPFTMSHSITSGGPDSLSNTQNPPDTSRDTSQITDFGKPDTLKTPPDSGIVVPPDSVTNDKGKLDPYW